MDNTLEWRPVPGFEKYYLVSNTGLIRNLPRLIRRRGGNNYLAKEKILSQMDNGCGYKCLTLCNGSGLYRKEYVHRIIALAFLENPCGYKEINHKDGNKSNNNVENLEWSNRSLNNKHAFAAGLHKPYKRFGKDNPNYKHGRNIKSKIAGYAGQI